MERHAEMTSVAIYRSYVLEVLAAGGFAGKNGVDEMAGQMGGGASAEGEEGGAGGEGEEEVERMVGWLQALQVN